MMRRLAFTSRSVVLIVGFCGLLSGSPAAAATIYVDLANCPGPGDGSPDNPFCKIQTAINAAVYYGDTILVADGVYTGTGNKDLDLGGRLLILRSASGDASACIIDCEGSGRGFYFHTGETAATVVDGFTVQNGDVTSSSPGGAKGGGVFCFEASPMLNNCTIRSNAAPGDGGGGVYCYSYANPTLNNCTISGNHGSYGGGLHVRYAASTLNNCTISGNTAFQGGGVYSYGGSSTPILTNCTIGGNRASGNGGGVYSQGSSRPTLIGCAITGNSSGGSGEGYGAGLYCYNSDATFTNCTISGNRAIGHGGGLYVVAAHPTLTNCTFSGNTATGEGGGVYVLGSSTNLLLTNCILWDDVPLEVNVSSGNVEVTFCDVQGGFPGAGNINIDPGFLFVDDFHLVAASPCIDTGTNNPVGGLPDQDADGNPRPLDGHGGGEAIADMGAYEFNPAAPSIAVSPPALEVFACLDCPNPPAKTLSIGNAGGGTLAWQLATDAPWLTADPVGGSCQQEVDTVAISFDLDGLTEGDYSRVLTVSSPAAGNSPRSVPLTLHLGAPRHVPAEYATIQAAIDAAAEHDWVLVEDGVYTGDGNKNLDFHGKSITVRSTSGEPTNCIVNCQGYGRGFYFHSGETHSAMVEGFTIRSGYITSEEPPGPDYAAGGGVYCYYSSPTLTNCIMTGNYAKYGGGVGCCYYAFPELVECAVSGNTSMYGGGIYCYINANSAFFDCTISNNTASVDGGGVNCFLARPALTNCRIIGNTSPTGGLYFEGSSPILSNCTIANNGGGGIYCLFAGPVLTNCTISRNTGSQGGALHCREGSPTLTNCILWGDTPQEVYVSGGTPTAVYCDIMGGYPGIGNVNLDPLFVSVADFHLQTDSPCIDAGTNNPTRGLPPLDADGNPRPLDGNGDGQAVADMGAYEFQPPPVCGDLDGDYDVDGADFAIFLAAYGRCSGDPQYNPAADLNVDGCVTLVDYQLWLQCYRAFNNSPFAPPPPPSDMGDVNGDGAIDGLDIQSFVDVLLNPGGAELRERFVTDFNGDGVTDAGDVAGFVEKLVGE